jgi:FtsZ-binding cell division protein ZapB
LENLRLQVSEIKAENKKLHQENQELQIRVGILSQEVKRLTALSK